MDVIRRWLGDGARDVRYAIRTLRRSPGFTAVAVLTLALGIGATTAIYSVVDAILLQPLPFHDADRLVRVVENIPIEGEYAAGGMTYPEFLEWRARTTTLADTVGFMPSRLVVRTGEGTARLWGGMTSVTTFMTLNAHAMVGRTLDPGDDTNPNVIVLGFDAWQRFFRSDPGVVGTPIEVPASEYAGRRLLTVVGVLPPGFEFPTARMDFYTPFMLEGASRTWASIIPIGRLRGGVSRQAATDEANVILGAVRPPRRADAPPLAVPRFEVQGLKDQIVRPLRPALRVLLGAVAVILMIVCANVANLLLARGSARRRELAVRLALGASRGRVVRVILAECLVLAMAGGAVGALLAAAGVTLVRELATVDAPGIFRLVFGPSILPRGREVGIDPKMFGIAFTIATMAIVLFGGLPAFHLSRTSHLEAMGPRGGGSGRGESRMRAALVVGQLVMATVLLVGAGLLAKSFVRLGAVERGYEPSRALAFQLVFPSEYSIPQKTTTIDALLARLRAAPDVEAAGFARAGVLIGEELILGTFVPQGRTLNEMRAYAQWPRVRAVSPGYLTAIGATVVEGADLDTNALPGPTPVLVINRTVARRFFGAASAVGRVVDWHMDQKPAVQARIAGVVDDLRNTSPDREPYPEIFVDYRQLRSLQQRWGDSPLWQNERSIGLLSFAVRTRTDPITAIPTVSRIVRAVDPNAGIDAILPMERLAASSVARPRFYAVMLGVFAGVAGCLAVIGIYGVLAYAVVQRTHEIGIRMALGARRAQVVALVLRQGLILTIAGIGLGVAAAAAGARVLQGMLFGISPLDVTTFVAVSLMFGLVAAFASYLPARRATKVDPMAALRSD